MPITAASVESNGWVLRLDVSGSPGSFASYTLAPNGSPRLVLSSSHPGFAKSAGQAVAATLARSLVGTAPLRKPVNWNGSGIDPFVVDEADLGGGVIRVRIALSEHVYATDTGLTLAVLAGWRAGESAATSVPVTNDSTIAAPLPIMRWALVPYEVTRGAFRVSIKVYSHHPQGFEPVAGVKFTATDGTNTKTIWVTELSTDNSYGDNLRCYTAIIDPATAMALTAGLLRVDAEIYPWLGAMRSTDPNGARSMSFLNFSGYNPGAASPWVIGYDPAGTRYSAMWAFVDPVNGTTTAAAAMVQPTLAAAKAIAPPARPRNIQTATQAGYLFNRTLPAANGQSSFTRSVDGMNIVLAAGTHSGLGAGNVTSGTQAGEIAVRIVGDPADPDPRNNVIIQTAASGISRHNRMCWQNLTIEAGSVGLVGSGMTANHLDNVTLRGKAGQENNSVAPFPAAPFANNGWNTAITRSRWWRYGTGPGSGPNRVGLFRGNEHSRETSSFTFAVKNRFIGNVEDGFTGTGPLGVIYGPWPSPAVLGQAEDFICAHNDMRFLRSRAWQPQGVAAATAGTPNSSIRRQVFADNVVERIGGSGLPFLAIGEANLCTMSYNIIEGNSFIGARANCFYSDPPLASVADTNNLRNQAFVNRIANNAFDWLPTKHDDIFDDVTAGLRGTGDGYRPHMVEAWSMLYGVCHEGNVLAERAATAGPGGFGLQFQGLRTVNGYGGMLDPLFSDDNSILGPDGAGAVGGGDYRPLAGSPVIGRGVRANVDVDADGIARPMPFAAGAFQTPLTVLAPALAPASTTSMLTNVAAQLDWTGAIEPERAQAPMRTATATLAVSTSLAPAVAAMAHAASRPGLSMAFSLQPVSASSATRNASAEFEPIRLTVVLAADGRLSLHATSPLLLVPGAVASATIIIGPDPRTVISNPN